MSRPALIISLIFVFLQASPLPGQEKSVKPGINKRFQNPNVKAFIKRLERDGREAYDKRKEIVKACKIKPGIVIADVGAGTGIFTRLFSDAVGPKGKVYAVDIAKNFIDHIERMAKTEKRTNIVGVVCTQKSVKLPAKSVDLVFVCDTYHHFEYPQKTLTTIRKALKPGGQLVLIDFHRIEGKSSKFILGHVRAGKKVFVDEIKKSGFKQVEERNDLMKQNYFVRFSKTKK